MPLFLALWSSAALAAPQTGEFETSFDVVPRYAHADFIAQRTFSPEALQRAMQDPQALQGVAIDPREERWKVYLPEACTADAPCGVLVWVSPALSADLPTEWKEVLDRHRVIFVSAFASGNEQDTFLRRLPLALTGLGAIVNRYAVDPGRIYSGGFSGGSKVAQRLAFAFPDIFKGAILNAGFIDPGSDSIYFPPAPLDSAVRDVRYYLAVGRRDKGAWREFNEAMEQFPEFGLTKLRDDVQVTSGHRLLTAGQLEAAFAFFSER